MRRRRGKRQCIPIRFCHAKLLTCLLPRPPGAWRCGHHETDIGSDQVCILPRHPPDQSAGLPRHRWSAWLSPPRLPCPEKPEPLAVPADDGFGSDDYQGVAPAWPWVRQGDPETLSAFRSDGRGLFRFRTATCCRRARISVWSAARSAKISMILCMPERVSGGDAKFQGFCDGWNKWEGQVIPRRDG